MFDAVELGNKTAEIVCKNGKRKYYRFRYAKFYGGIATADCVGCNLRCKFCWAWNIVTNAKKVGKFYGAKEVAKKLMKIAKEKNVEVLRISGNEPTLCKEHLIEILENINEKFYFILETNGIVLGYDFEFVKKLSKFDNLHVRVSLKGSNAEEFAKLTNAKEENFEFQLKALQNLKKAKISFHPAIISIANADMENLRKKLEKIDKGLWEKLEIEPIILYPNIRERLKKAGII